ncbi:MAG: outer membrane beta-barrel protein [Lentisphaeria bacterium]|nr:outer membrane beta-barrel protein [Lentisphaeria bacterium]
MMASQRRGRALFGGLLLAMGLVGARATTIQMSPLVGHRAEGLYRAPSYLRSVDQYARQAEQDYTIKLGNLRLQLSLGLEAEWEDNVNHAGNRDKEDGITLMPTLHVGMYWPLNPGLQIHSGVVLGYRWYVSGGGDREDEGLIVTGTEGAVNAQFSADMRVGKSGLLSASEEFVRDIDAFTAGPRDDSGYAINRNLINLQYRNEFTDLTSGTIKLAHTNQWADDSHYEETDHYSDFLDAVLLHHLNRYVQVGPYVRAGLHRYTEDMHNDSEEIDGGLSLVYSKTERFVVSTSAGYSWVTFDTENTPTATDEYSGWTTQAAVRYSNNQATTHRLTVTYGAEQGHLSRGTNYSKELVAQYTISVQLREDLLANGDAGYINARESDGGDNYDLYRVGIGLGYRLSRDTIVDLRYRREWRDSDDQEAGDYTSNSIVLRIVHRL